MGELMKRSVLRTNPTGFSVRRSGLDWIVVDAGNKPVPGKRFSSESAALSEIGRLDAGAVTMAPAAAAPAAPRPVAAPAVVRAPSQFNPIAGMSPYDVVVLTLKGLGLMTWHPDMHDAESVRWNLYGDPERALEDLRQALHFRLVWALMQQRFGLKSEPRISELDQYFDPRSTVASVARSSPHAAEIAREFWTEDRLNEYREVLRHSLSN